MRSFHMGTYTDTSTYVNMCINTVTHVQKTPNTGRNSVNEGSDRWKLIIVHHHFPTS